MLVYRSVANLPNRVSGLTSPRGVDAGVINGDGPGDAKEGGGERLGLTRVGGFKPPTSTPATPPFSLI